MFCTLFYTLLQHSHVVCWEVNPVVSRPTKPITSQVNTIVVNTIVVNTIVANIIVVYTIVVNIIVVNTIVVHTVRDP